MVLGAVLLAGCSAWGLTPVKLPAPPAWAMQPCAGWPRLASDARIDLDQASRAVVEAKTALAECDGRHSSLVDYVEQIVKPGG